MLGYLDRTGFILPINCLDHLKHFSALFILLNIRLVHLNHVNSLDACALPLDGSVLEACAGERAESGGVGFILLNIRLVHLNHRSGLFGCTLLLSIDIHMELCWAISPA